MPKFRTSSQPPQHTKFNKNDPVYKSRIAEMHAHNLEKHNKLKPLTERNDFHGNERTLDPKVHNKEK